jgi:hypothetical protein
MGFGRRALSLLVAAVIAAPLAVTVSSRPVSAACYDTWTGLETDSKSGSYGIFAWSGSVTYKLKTNTCNLGVYTEIYVDRFTSRFHVNAPDPSYFYRSPFATILADCKGHTSGCLTDQGRVVAPVDTRKYDRRGTGYLPSSGSYRTFYPRAYYPYSSTTAFMDSVCSSCDVPYVMVIFQFRRNVLYMNSGIYDWLPAS